MKEARLTAQQMKELAPYERNFEQATQAAYCSYPGQAGIDKMLDIWQSITGSKYPYQPGCANCLLNLVRDMGTLYMVQKAEEDRKKKEAEEKAEAERQKAALEEAAKKAAADATATAEKVSRQAEGLEPGGPEGNEPSGTSEKPKTHSDEKPAKDGGKRAKK